MRYSKRWACSEIGLDLQKLRTEPTSGRLKTKLPPRRQRAPPSNSRMESTVLACLDYLKTEMRTWRDARVQVCEANGKLDEDIAKLDVWICSEFSIDAMPSFNGDAIKQKACDFRRACNTYALVTELEKLPSTVAAVDAMDWYANGAPTNKAILWPLISRLYRKLELELPEDTRGLFETWLREDDFGREAIRIKLQVRLNAYRIASNAKQKAQNAKAMLTKASQTKGTVYSPAELSALGLYGEGVKPAQIDKTILSPLHRNPQRWTGQVWLGEKNERRVTQTTKELPKKWEKGDAAKLVRHAKDNSYFTTKEQQKELVVSSATKVVTNS